MLCHLSIPIPDESARPPRNVYSSPVGKSLVLSRAASGRGTKWPWKRRVPVATPCRRRDIFIWESSAVMNIGYCVVPPNNLSTQLAFFVVLKPPRSCCPPILAPAQTIIHRTTQLRMTRRTMSRSFSSSWARVDCQRPVATTSSNAHSHQTQMIFTSSSLLSCTPLQESLAPPSSCCSLLTSSLGSFVRSQKAPFRTHPLLHPHSGRHSEPIPSNLVPSADTPHLFRLLPSHRREIASQTNSLAAKHEA